MEARISIREEKGERRNREEIMVKEEAREQEGMKEWRME